MKKLFILLACISVLWSCEEKDDNDGGKPELFYYREPIVNFGASKEEIKKQERQPLLEETITTILYQGVESQTLYIFEEYILIGSAVGFHISTGTKPISEFLSSRYDTIGQIGGIFAWQSKDKTMLIALQSDPSTEMIIVTYEPMSPLAPEKMQISRSAELTASTVSEEIKATFRQLIK